MKNFAKVICCAALAVLSAGLISCATAPACNNDACYDRKISSVDAYKAGDIAAWGNEKEAAQQEEEKEFQQRGAGRKFDSNY